MKTPNDISVDLPEFSVPRYGYSFAPGDIEELCSWCNLQADLYEKINVGWENYRSDANLATVYNQSSNLASLRQHAAQLMAQVESSDEPSAIASVAVISSIANSNFEVCKLPPADSVVGKLLAVEVERDFKIGLPALYALSAPTQKPNHQFSYWYPEMWRGLGIGASLSMALSPVAASSAFKATEFQQQLSDLQTGVGRTRKRAEVTARNMTNKVKEFEDKVVAFDLGHTTALSEAKTVLAALVGETREKLEKFTDFTKSEIALKAPITYWQDKAIGHENQAFAFGLASILLMFLAAIGLVHSMPSFQAMVGLGDRPNYIGIVVVFGLTTLGFWLLRLTVKIFLSQQHLGTDARERVAMVKTYMALSEAGLAPKEGDLSPVLVALFRTSSDGIVKDEGMPPIIAELLTRSSKSN